MRTMPRERPRLNAAADAMNAPGVAVPPNAAILGRRTRVKAPDQIPSMIAMRRFLRALPVDVRKAMPFRRFFLGFAATPPFILLKREASATFDCVVDFGH